MRNLLVALLICLSSQLANAAAVWVESDASAAISSTSMTHTVPAGWAVGDLVIMFMKTGTRTIVTPAADWTAIDSEEVNSENIYAYWKILDADDAGTAFTWEMNAATASKYMIYHRITGAATSAPINISADSDEGSSTTTHVSPTVTTTVDDCLILRMMPNGGQTLTASSGDTGTQRYQDNTVGIALFTSSKLTAGATGTATYTTGTARNLNHIVVGIEPDVAPPVILTSDAQAMEESERIVCTMEVVGAEVVTWSITGGADSALFSVDTDTGELTMPGSADFETPEDVGTNNVYEVELTATNGAGTDALLVLVTVTDEGGGVVNPLRGGTVR